MSLGKGSRLLLLKQPRAWKMGEEQQVGEVPKSTENGEKHAVSAGGGKP